MNGNDCYDCTMPDGKLANMRERAEKAEDERDRLKEAAKRQAKKAKEIQSCLDRVFNGAQPPAGSDIVKCRDCGDDHIAAQCSFLFFWDGGPRYDAICIQCYFKNCPEGWYDYSCLRLHERRVRRGE